MAPPIQPSRSSAQPASAKPCTARKQRSGEQAKSISIQPSTPPRGDTIVMGQSASPRANAQPQPGASPGRRSEASMSTHLLTEENPAASSQHPPLAAHADSNRHGNHRRYQGSRTTPSPFTLTPASRRGTGVYLAQPSTAAIETTGEPSAIDASPSRPQPDQTAIIANQRTIIHQKHDAIQKLARHIADQGRQMRSTQHDMHRLEAYTLALEVRLKDTEEQLELAQRALQEQANLMAGEESAGRS